MKTKLFLLLFFFISLTIIPVNACHDDTMVCKASIVVSLGPFCTADVTPIMVLDEFCPDKPYKVQIFDDPPALVNDLTLPLDGSYIGSTLVAKVTDTDSGNACTADVQLRDITPPFIDFVGTPINLSCQDDLSEVISIGVVDNCGSSTYKISDIRHECVPCEYDKVFITYELTDEYGNVGYETKEFEFSDFCMDVEFPEDVTFNCPPEMDEIPGITVNDSDRFCPLVVDINYGDIRIGCDISRIYTIEERCSGRTITHTQIIDVVDFPPPTVFYVPGDGPITLEEYNDGYKPLHVAAAHCGILYTVTDQIIKEVISCDPLRFLVLYSIEVVDVCYNASPKATIIVEVIAEDPPKVKISGQKDCRSDFVVTAKPRDMVEPITYSWSISNPAWTITPIPGTNTASVNPGGGKATVEVTAVDAAGCVETDTKKYYCKRIPFGFFHSNNDVNIFPNPTTDYAEIFVASEEITSVEVYAVSGQKMISLSDVRNNAVQIDMEKYAPGLYFVRINTETDTWTERIVKE